MALEFILLLKNTLYSAVVPDRNKRATQNTLVQPWQKTLGPRSVWDRLETLKRFILEPRTRVEMQSHVPVLLN